MSMNMDKIAHWAFIAFVVIAIVMGLVVGYMTYNGDSAAADINGWVVLILLILGIIIGLTSITVKEVQPFLIAAIALIVASSANVWGGLGNIHELLFDWATMITRYIVAFAAPAAVIIAIKGIIEMSRSK